MDVGGLRQATREQCRGQRVEIGLARQRHDPAARVGVPPPAEAAARHFRDWWRTRSVLAGPPLGPAGSHRAARPRPDRAVRQPRRVAPAWRFACAAASDLPARLAGSTRQRRRTFEKRGRRSEPAARLGTCGGAFQIRGDILIWHDCCLRPVPGAAIRVAIGIGRLRKRLMDLRPLSRAGGPIDRRANEWMPEGHARPEHDQTA